EHDFARALVDHLEIEAAAFETELAERVLPHAVAGDRPGARRSVHGGDAVELDVDRIDSRSIGRNEPEADEGDPKGALHTDTHRRASRRRIASMFVTIESPAKVSASRERRPASSWPLPQASATITGMKPRSAAWRAVGSIPTSKAMPAMAMARIAQSRNAI